MGDAVKELQTMLKQDRMYQQRLAGFLISVQEQPFYLIKNIKSELYPDDTRKDSLLYYLALNEFGKRSLLERALKKEDLFPDADICDVLAALRLNEAVPYDVWYNFALEFGDDADGRLINHPEIRLTIDEIKASTRPKQAKLHHLKPR